MRENTSSTEVASRGGLLTRYLQEQFSAKSPPGWRCTRERALLDGPTRAILGYDPRADIMLERADGSRRLWIEFEVSRADPAANHAKFATAHVLCPWDSSDTFVSMISAHVVRGRRNLGAGMIHLMREVGISAFQTALLPLLDRNRIQMLNHDARALHEGAPDVAPELERVLSIATPVAATVHGRLHLAADVFDVMLNVRQWNGDADAENSAERWRRRSIRYLVVDPSTAQCAPAKFASYIVLVDRPQGASGSRIDSRMTFERYLGLDGNEPAFDGHRAWTHLVQRLGFVPRSLAEAPDAAHMFESWYRLRDALIDVNRAHLTLLLPPLPFR